ncbi:hypothetical protein A9K58_00240 [Stenotrophomonas maltophilia]|uniref:Uncharacterized protein n=1 Tax=Stenotrophomonas maltophilia TaxID=40324 RepID=A0A1A6Y6N6_STEMA|nr:hypothetical protein [Stenotrophomonas maltophilia]OBU70416.1 hypothetical protein A9K58_00240 [Stenotrophomonas maltophilia]
MNTNKTLADVKPGGRVRLGDQLVLAKLVGAAGLMLAEIDTCGHEVDPAYRRTLYEAWEEGKAALSAQPSPDGQNVLFIEELAELRRLVPSVNQKQALDAAIAALAARQPVGEPVAYWLAVDKDGIVEFGMSADDGNAGQAARQEMNDFINGPLHDGGAPHRLVGVYAAPPAQQPAQVYLDGLDRALGEAIDQRDRYHEVADDLAGHLARITGADIGEHSSANCPWQNAIDAAEAYQPAQAVDLGAARQLAEKWMRIGGEDARFCAGELMALIDSQAVGK